jgi:hypothetical protein
MKTFKQFCAEAYQLDEFRVGNPLNNPLVKKVGGFALRGLGMADALNPKETPANRVAGALSAVKPFSPVTIGASLYQPVSDFQSKQRQKRGQQELSRMSPSERVLSGYRANQTR